MDGIGEEQLRKEHITAHGLRTFLPFTRLQLVTGRLAYAPSVGGSFSHDSEVDSNNFK